MDETKEIQLLIKVTVPKWAKYVAVDANGNIMAYKKKPERAAGVWGPDILWRDCYRISNTFFFGAPFDWTKTLRKIG